MRLASALLLGLAAGLASASGATAAPAQRLQIDVRSDRMTVDGSERYTQGEPIAVRVIAPGDGTVELVGVSPRGSTLHFPLVRGADGANTTTLVLPILGTWSLAVATSSRRGAAPSTGPTIPVVVAEAGASDAAAAAMAALAVASIGGGLGLIAVGRRRAAAARA